MKGLGHLSKCPAAWMFRLKRKEKQFAGQLYSGPRTLVTISPQTSSLPWMLLFMCILECWFQYDANCKMSMLVKCSNMPKIHKATNNLQWKDISEYAESLICTTAHQGSIKTMAILCSMTPYILRTCTFLDVSLHDFIIFSQSSETN